VNTFSTGEAHRWRNIAEMVPGKNAAQCQSRARDDDFIKAHRYSGEKKGASASEPSLDSKIREGDTDARLAELIIAFPGRTTRRWRAIARAMGGGWSADDCLSRACRDDFVKVHGDDAQAARVEERIKALPSCVNTVPVPSRLTCANSRILGMSSLFSVQALILMSVGVILTYMGQFGIASVSSTARSVFSKRGQTASSTK
jgi:hypothetical protein